MPVDIRNGIKIRRERLSINGPRRTLLCVRCNATMVDREPASGWGEFYHLDNGCSNSSKRFTMAEGPNDTFRDRGVMPFAPKKLRRQIKRGGRLAAQYRPGRP